VTAEKDGVGVGIATGGIVQEFGVDGCDRCLVHF
jgi:hypothetical protein